MHRTIYLLFLVFTYGFIWSDSANYWKQNNLPKIQPDQKPLCLRSYVNPLKKENLLFFEGEYLYWKPIANIPYVQTMDLIVPHGNTNRVRTNHKLRRIPFSSKSGFRVKAGAYLPIDGWTTSCRYQYLQKTNGRNAEGPPRDTTIRSSENEALSAVWRTVYLTDNANSKLTSASATQRFSYKVFDWDLKKSIFFRTQFGLSPYFGVRGAWINNRLNANYNGVYIASNNLGSIKDDAKVKAQFRGWGLRGGFFGSWMLGSGFEVSGNSSLSLLWSKYTFRQDENFIAMFNFVPHPGFVQTHTVWKDIQSAIDLSLGVSWGTYFWNHSAYIGMKVAYETSIWPNLIQLRRILREDNINISQELRQPPFDMSLNSSVALKGWTFGAKLDF